MHGITFIRTYDSGKFKFLIKFHSRNKNKGTVKKYIENCLAIKKKLSSKIAYMVLVMCKVSWNENIWLPTKYTSNEMKIERQPEMYEYIEP